MAENVLDIVVALYSFTSTNDQELSFEKGDRLEILDRPPSDPEWYKARNNGGQIGLIPKNYVQVLALFFENTFATLNLSNWRLFDSIFLILLQELSEYLTQPMGNGVVRTEPSDQNGTCIERPYLGGKSWYYGNISRAQCDTLLNNHGLDGDFLIRDSETNVST